MAVGKRSSTEEPLTEHDVAERIDAAALRLLRILMDIRQVSPQYMAEVKGSRYLTNALDLLDKEVDLWLT